jgi:CO/xanthine dehydrogenase Mo-binding subunit
MRGTGCPSQPVLAQRRVRYVGDPVAAVFAEDPYVAEDAADLVAVEIAPLPALQFMEQGSPLLIGTGVVRSQ